MKCVNSCVFVFLLLSNGPDNTIAELNIRNKRFVAPNMSGDQTIISQTDISEEDVDGSERVSY